MPWATCRWGKNERRVAADTGHGACAGSPVPGKQATSSNCGIAENFIRIRSRGAGACVPAFACWAYMHECVADLDREQNMIPVG